MLCSGADGGKYEKKGNHGVGLAVRESIVAGMDKGDVAVECISARLMKVRIQLTGKFNGESSIVGYAPTLDKSTSENNYFWSSRDEVVKGLPSRDHLLVLHGRECSYRHERDRVDRQQGIGCIRT